MKGNVWRRCLALGCVVGVWMTFMIIPCFAVQETAVVSHGLQILAATSDVAVAAPVGNEVVFSADVFARGLNLSRVDFITVKSLPPVTDGELLLGSSRVAEGQTVAASELPYLVFCAAEEREMQSSFGFTVNGSSVTMVCNVYLLEQTNYTPTVSMASGLSLNQSTYRDLCVHGRLSAYDPDGDDLTFEVVSYPQNGWIEMTDRGLGTYVYTPYSGYVGSDRFSYVARDKYGNYSAMATVELKIALSGTAVTYVDMTDSHAYGAALALTEAGVMSGTQVGNQHYFYPDDTVTRAEFLVMAMNAAGITNVPNCYDTGFADDADIPPTMKGYVATAYAMKYISGSLVEGELRFLPNEEITRAQAAVILSGIVGLCDVAVTPTFADGSEIPVWASEAIYSLNAAGIMTSEDGYISATAKLTREQTAQLLAAVMQYMN
ncbi:MAG: S-layer homology domain-containing protein [Clostridia bacterium]|nr:S-layer homology domain-containing protein [Clostridia bacterium]